MKIKIRDQVYDSTYEPICVLLSPADRKNIAEITDEMVGRYSCAPLACTGEALHAFMDDDRLLHDASHVQIFACQDGTYAADVLISNANQP